jgi:hypothetical protein
MIALNFSELKPLLIHPFEFAYTIPEKTLNAAYRHYVCMVLVFTLFFGGINITLNMFSFTAYAQHYSSVPFIGPLLSGFLLNFSNLILNWSIFATYVIFLHLFAGIFLFIALLEMSVLLIGGEQGYCQTAKALMYAATPALLLGWIPWLWIIGCVWSIVLLVFFIEQTQRVDKIQGVLIVLVPLLLGGILIILSENTLLSFIDAIDSISGKKG